MKTKRILIATSLILTGCYFLDQLTTSISTLPPATTSNQQISTLKNQGSLEGAIRSDLETLKKSNQLDSNFNKIKKVFILDHRKSPIETEKVNWSTLSHQFFPESKSGIYDLQIEVFDDKPTTSESTVAQNSQAATGTQIANQTLLQFNFFEPTSKNKIMEISRTLKTNSN